MPPVLKTPIFRAVIIVFLILSRTTKFRLPFASLRFPLVVVGALVPRPRQVIGLSTIRTQRAVARGMV